MEKIDYKGLTFILDEQEVIEDIEKIEDRIVELSYLGYKTEWDEGSENYKFSVIVWEHKKGCSLKQDKWSIDKVADELNKKLEFGNRNQIDALKVGEVIRLEFNLDPYDIIERLEKYKKDKETEGITVNNEYNLSILSESFINEVFFFIH